MFRHLPKLLAAAAALLFVAGCTTHYRSEYRYPLAWKTHPASEAELPAPAPTSPVAPVSSASPLTPPALPQH